MIKLNFFLLVALFFCALSIVNSQHEVRHLFNELEQAQLQERELDLAWERLQLAHASHAHSGLIAHIAREQLKLVPIRPDQTHYVRRPMGVSKKDVSHGPEK